jgi:3-phenylpropionate/trans-cinnamate dioxygenase ferredoxin reductase component
MSEPGVVVVGAGLASAHVASTIRDADDQRPVAIIGDEGRRPYERPGLSKGVLQGKDEPDSLYVHDAGWYEQNDIQTRFEDPAIAIDLAERRVTLASGESVEYADLVIATGARPRTIDLPGAGLPGVRTLRRIPDSLALRESFGEGRRLVVIGAGWIGLEVAAAATEAGTHVTVLESADVPLRAALGERMGKYFAQLHRTHGVDLRTGITISGIEGGEAVTGVRAGGELFPADLVVVGVGAVPNTELAQKAGLTVDNGIVVDEHLRAREHVYAIGDVANASSSALGTRVRVEHWDNAIRQGKLAGRLILGDDARYDWQPYFYTDQFDLGMEYVGRGGPDDDVVLRGSEQSGEFIAFWQRHGVVTAAMNVNIWDVNDDLRALIGRQIDSARLADDRVALPEL